MRRNGSIFSALVLGTVLALASQPSAAAGGDAVANYKKGRTLIEQRRFEDALVALEKSNAEMASPNTLLLIAHANRALGRLARAAQQYERVISEADAKIKSGEARFQPTADDARSWLDKISKDLGWVLLKVIGASADAVVRVQSDVVTPTSVSDGVLAFDKIWVNPGQVVVTADLPGRASRTVTVEVPRGGPATVMIDLSNQGEAEESPAVASAKPAVETGGEGRPGRRIPTTTWVAGGVGVAGMATFALFGSMARSKANELDRCSPSCPQSERSTADAGKRDQTIANVGLVVGGIGLATAIGFYVWQPRGEQEQVGVAVVPGGVTVVGTF